MWIEQNNERVNVKRTLQLIDTGATTVASACLLQRPHELRLSSRGLRVGSRCPRARNQSSRARYAARCPPHWPMP
jgi:hypothetical protein